MKKLTGVVTIAAIFAVIYFTGCSKNEPPVIDSFTTDPVSDTIITAGDTVKIILEVSDPDEDSLTVKLEADGGTLQGTSESGDITWISPRHSGFFNLVATVIDKDTLNPVSSTLAIEVQNYFPIALDYKWVYGGVYLNQDVTLEVTVFREEIEGSLRRWRLRRILSLLSDQYEDTLSYYSVNGDSISFYDGYSKETHLVLLMPLWLERTWNAGEGATGSVAAKDTVGTEAGIFFNCYRIDLDGIDETGNVYETWVAPDVGIIVQTVLYPLLGAIDFELTDYDLTP